MGLHADARPIPTSSTTASFRAPPSSPMPRPSSACWSGVRGRSPSVAWARPRWTRVGNINSTRLDDGRFLVGSGGANDVASRAAACVVVTLGRPERLPAEVAYVTAPGDRVTAWSPTVASSANSTEGCGWPRCRPGPGRSTNGSGPWWPPAVGSPRWPIEVEDLATGDHGRGARAAPVRSPTAVPRLTRPDDQVLTRSPRPPGPGTMPVRSIQLRLTSQISVS